MAVTLTKPLILTPPVITGPFWKSYIITAGSVGGCLDHSQFSLRHSPALWLALVDDILYIRWSSGTTDNTNNTTISYRCTTTPIEAGKDYHITLTANASNGCINPKIWINGVAQELDPTGTSANPSTSIHGVMSVGRYWMVNESWSLAPYEGKIPTDTVFHSVEFGTGTIPDETARLLSASHRKGYAYDFLGTTYGHSYYAPLRVPIGEDLTTPQTLVPVGWSHVSGFEWLNYGGATHQASLADTLDATFIQAAGVAAVGAGTGLATMQDEGITEMCNLFDFHARFAAATRTCGITSPIDGTSMMRTFSGTITDIQMPVHAEADPNALTLQIYQDGTPGKGNVNRCYRAYAVAWKNTRELAVLNTQGLKLRVTGRGATGAPTTKGF